MQVVAGLLYSQIGYDLHGSKRAVVRGPALTLPDGATFAVQNEHGTSVLTGPAAYWGALWGSHWWTCDLSTLPAGTYTLAVADLDSEAFTVAPHLLWQQTWRHVALEQNERRALLAMNKIGWQDCGASWQEADSHAALIIGLTDLLEFATAELTDTDRARVEAQIVNGCNYLALLQDRAAALHLGAGAVSHQTPKFEEVALPSDAAQSAVAWARAARFLTHSGKASDYADRARRAFQWLRTAARPMGTDGFTPSNHGAAEDFSMPAGEWMTRDLVMQAWAAVELCLCGHAQFQEDAVRLAAQITARQVTAEGAEAGLWGHFRTFGTGTLTEKAWTHNVLNDRPGADTGGHFPHYILPLLRMRQAWPAHPDAPRWEKSVRDFAYHYLLPACRANPFFLLPLGVFQGELLWFAGLWHGMNAGVTAESLAGCVMWDADWPVNVAVPCSLLNGIGTRWAGSWLNVRGAICNGFSTGAQFAYDVLPTAENDGPHTLTDEDWITHAGAWLSALARLT